MLFGAQVINAQVMGQQTDPRYEIYQAVGKWLAENIPADGRVGALEVGIIGFFAQRSMVDFAGLIQPDVAEIMTYDTTYDDTAIWAVRTYRPEYLALVEGGLPRLMKTIVREYCQPVQRFSANQYDFRADMRVYRCSYE
jgi:hypothetical protein